MKMRKSWIIIFILCIGIYIYTINSYTDSVTQSKNKYLTNSGDFKDIDNLNSIIASLKKNLEDNPEDISMHIDLGISYYQKGKSDYIDALNSLNRASDLGACDDRTFYYSGIMYEEIGLLDLSTREYQKFLRLHPDNIYIRIRLGNTFKKAKEFDSALNEYLLAQAHSPMDPVIHFNIGWVYFEKEMYDEALKSFTRAFEINPDLSQIHHALASVFLKQDKTDMALAELLLELDTNPKSLQANLDLAQVYEKTGNKEKAKKTWKTVLDLDPNNAEAKMKL